MDPRRPLCSYPAQARHELAHVGNPQLDLDLAFRGHGSFRSINISFRLRRKSLAVANPFLAVAKACSTRDNHLRFRPNGCRPNGR